jgi:hypothetical protein
VGNPESGFPNTYSKISKKYNVVSFVFLINVLFPFCGFFIIKKSKADHAVFLTAAVMATSLLSLLTLKVPKCEIFHLFDFNDFYGINVGQIRTILSLLAYAPSTLATIFDFELEQKKSYFRFP